MLIDARKLPSSTTLDAEICIVGGGVAGITLALEFERHGLTTCLLEGGMIDFNSAAQALYQGTNTGLPYDLRTSRTRQLGGSSNCWGGWIRPFIEIDFEQRDWVPNSGWPIAYADVAAFYSRASKLVQVNDRTYEPEFWQERLQAEQIRLLELRGGSLETVVSKFSPPTRFGYVYQKQLEAALSTKVLLNANVTELEVSENAATVTGVHFANPAGERFFVRAKQTILAAGGVENARLMLLSNKVEHRGLGNRYDLVGRYFMEHPRVRGGRVIPSGDAAAFRFYDTSYTYHNPRLAVEGTSGSAYIGLAEHVQRKEELVQCRTYFRACRTGEDPEVTERFREFYETLAWRLYGDIKPGKVAALALNSPSLLASLLFRKLRLASKSTYLQIESVVEPVPDPESRVTLCSQRDKFGQNLAELDWRVGELEKRTHQRMLALVKEEFEAFGLGQVELDQVSAGHEAPILWCHHHMGTTRMHTDPRLGVVDANCKVHGMHNLHIAGSSIFPTCGNDMPTLTIAALALRLADHLALNPTTPAYRSAPVAMPL